MENVTNSMNYLQDYYTFKDLNLSKWARKQKLSPKKKAIILKNNQYEINSANYGSAQNRNRVISGEFINKGKLLIPSPTHQSPADKEELPAHISLSQVKEALPSPNALESDNIITDPLYSSIYIMSSELTDHFYDTGLYECEWKQSKFLKVNHPYMGKMSFPENEQKPSRTITATKIGTSREAIIYRSEYNRIGDGEFRTPTIRESASIMGFPITYQFMGSEGVKCRLIGNAVCPSVSRAFAKLVREIIGLKAINTPIVQLKPNRNGVNNLNAFSPKVFETPPRRNKGSRFRRHPFKDGNFTVTLSNYDIIKNEKNISQWITSVQFGNGEGFPVYNFPNEYYKKIEPIIEGLKNGNKFLEIIKNGFTDKIGDKMRLQEMYELQKSIDGLLEPSELIEEVTRIIENIGLEQEMFFQSGQNVFKNKEVFPVKQLFALYAINKISTIANEN